MVHGHNRKTQYIKYEDIIQNRCWIHYTAQVYLKDKLSSRFSATESYDKNKKALPLGSLMGHGDAHKRYQFIHCIYSTTIMFIFSSFEADFQQKFIRHMLTKVIDRDVYHTIPVRQPS